MKLQTLIPLLLSVLCTGCNEPMKTLGCLSSGKALVMVFGNDPTALDGYNYRICTARMGSPKCSEYNRISAERPAAITVSLAGQKVHIDQAGGSVFDYSTDPAGMKDADYSRSIPIELTFVSKSTKGFSDPVYQVDGKTVSLQRCPAS